MLTILENLRNTFFYRKKIQLQFSKSGVFSEKKIESVIGKRPFFESMSEAKCPEKPLANLEKPLANIEKPLAMPRKAAREPRKAACEYRKAAREWVRKPCVPNCDTPHLKNREPKASGNELPTSLPPYLPTDQKSFSDLSENLHIWSLDRINIPLFGKKMRKKF